MKINIITLFYYLWDENEKKIFFVSETLEILLYALSMYSLVYNSLHYGCILTYIKMYAILCSLMLWEYKSYDDIKVHDMKKHILVVKKNETSHQLALLP